MKRWREIKAKPGQIKAGYGRVDGGLDLSYAWGGGGAQKPDVRVLMRALEDMPVFEGKSLRDVLTERGYDITTLRFSIERTRP